MKTTTRSLIAGLGIFAGVALAFGWQQRKSKREADTALATTLQERANVDAEILRTRQRLASAEKDQAELQSALDAVRKTKAQRLPTQSADPSPRPAAPAPPARVRVAEVLNRNPNLRAALEASRRNSTVNSFHPLARALGLSGLQREKFEDLLVQREEQRTKLAELSRSGDAADRAAVEVQRKQDDEAFRRAQISLLGETGYEQLQQFERMLPLQYPVSKFAGATALAGVPLTPGQGEQLTTILAQASVSFRQGRQASHMDVDWSAVDVQARQILSPEQFSIFTAQEPIGGGPSRFIAALNKELEDAKKKDAAGMTKPPGN